MKREELVEGMAVMLEKEPVEGRVEYGSIARRSDGTLGYLSNGCYLPNTVEELDDATLRKLSKPHCPWCQRPDDE